MTTRTTGERERLKLFDRYTIHEPKMKLGQISFVGSFVRAEYDGLARLLRKLDDSDGGKHKQTTHFTCGYYQAIHDVLAIIKERKK